MATKFRKSFFGFNSDDVNDYINKTHKEHSEEVTVLNEKIESLSDSLSVAETNLRKIASENAQLQAKLKVYTDKYDEIERLAQNIGKLYVVANANAKAIMESAESNIDISKSEVEKNFKNADDIQKSLLNTRAEITKTAAEFSERLDGLLRDLEIAKTSVSDNEKSSDQMIEEFNSLIKSI